MRSVQSKKLTSRIIKFGEKHEKTGKLYDSSNNFVESSQRTGSDVASNSSRKSRERERELIFFADFSTCEYGGIGRGCRKHGDRLYGGSLAGWNASIFRKEAVSPPPSFPEGGGKTTRVQWRRDASVAQSNRNRTIHSRFRYSARPFAFNLRSVFLPPNLPIVLFILLVCVSLKNDLEKSIFRYLQPTFPLETNDLGGTRCSLHFEQKKVTRRNITN